LGSRSHSKGNGPIRLRAARILLALWCAGADAGLIAVRLALPGVNSPTGTGNPNPRRGRRARKNSTRKHAVTAAQMDSSAGAIAQRENRASGPERGHSCPQQDQPLSKRESLWRNWDLLWTGMSALRP